MVATTTTSLANAPVRCAEAPKRQNAEALKHRRSKVSKSRSTEVLKRLLLLYEPEERGARGLFWCLLNTDHEAL
jgi:hypothetical protein